MSRQDAQLRYVGEMIDDGSWTLLMMRTPDLLLVRKNVRRTYTNGSSRCEREKASHFKRDYLRPTGRPLA
jgi:hypothetical protein